ncbi:DUF3892 domain-containing protein [Piscibacillus halophilus]|uniref:DUF3892 domain-containing protein n=1 Tax=Piscibacillus halophilus TaxID=571933 RepID=A0A1H9ICJ7_9BACI|nr:DUF3892 domain-containing protein [Piscibacillus halophilus]SEQ72276.1 Protein of unknown function [Piscibacillus halophilus]
MDQETFVAVRKNGDGDITHFKTSSGRELDYDQALQEVENGTIDGVNIGQARNGKPVIRGNADGDPSNNLDNLESF